MYPAEGRHSQGFVPPPLCSVWVVLSEGFIPNVMEEYGDQTQLAECAMVEIFIAMMSDVHIVDRKSAMQYVLDNKEEFQDHLSCCVPKMKMAFVKRVAEKIGFIRSCMDKRQPAYKQMKGLKWKDKFLEGIVQCVKTRDINAMNV